MLILFYTIQKVIPNICSKFQNPRYSSSWEIFDTNFPMYCDGMRDGKMEKDRQKLITPSWFPFPQYTWPLSRCKQNLKTLTVIGAENSVTKSFIGEKEKWTNKGNDKQQHADSLLHNMSYPTFVPNFKILGAVNPEKSLTQISLCITLEWEMEKRKNGKRW